MRVTSFVENSYIFLFELVTPRDMFVVNNHKAVFAQNDV